MIHVGDVLQVLPTLDAASVQTCVTSPPYFGLRDYGQAGQIGLEATPDAYVARLVEVFREVRRVLRDDGTLWLNLGDSYAGGKVGRDDADRDQRLRGVGDGYHNDSVYRSKQRPVPAGLKPKDLIGIPWMVAFALRADGWYLRQDIIWHKPNPMPESVKDRCTKAHEYLFLLSKSPRYYFDAAAIAEPAVQGPHVRNRASNFKKAGALALRPHNASTGVIACDGTRNRRDVWTVATKPFKGAHFACFPPKLIEPCVLAGSPIGGTVLDPFFGAGTTGLVAKQHGRAYVGIELNPEYAKLAEDRINAA